MLQKLFPKKYSISTFPEGSLILSKIPETVVKKCARTLVSLIIHGGVKTKQEGNAQNLEAPWIKIYLLQNSSDNYIQDAHR